MSAVQRMKVANERHSKTITQRGHVQKTSVLTTYRAISHSYMTTFPSVTRETVAVEHTKSSSSFMSAAAPNFEPGGGKRGFD